MRLDRADYPPRVRLRCPGLPAEPSSWSTFYSWPEPRATWLPGLFPVMPSLGVREKEAQGSRSDPAAARSFGCLPQCPLQTRLGVDPANGSLLDVTLLPAPARITEGSQAGTRRGSQAALRCAAPRRCQCTKQPAKLSELMRCSCRVTSAYVHKSPGGRAGLADAGC